MFNVTVTLKNGDSQIAYNAEVWHTVPYNGFIKIRESTGEINLFNVDSILRIQMIPTEN